jgi:hypothetical protein
MAQDSGRVARAQSPEHETPAREPDDVWSYD